MCINKVEAAGLPCTEMLDMILGALTGVARQPGLRRLARMVIAESGNFPELAALWREKVVSPTIDAIAGAVSRAQAQGEVRPGDSRLIAFSIAGPLIMGLLWREVIEPAGGELLDFDALAGQHRAVLQAGLLDAR